MLEPRAALLTLAYSRILRAKDNSPVHQAADAHLGQVQSVVLHAFQKGRGAYKEGGAGAAAAAIKESLRAHLPAVLLRALVDGANAGLGMLPKLKAAGDVEGHEFHGNQWTSGGGANAKEVDSRIKEHVDHVVSEAKKSGAIESVSIVGSWATKHSDRMPDRGGKKSDIDVMITPKGAASFNESGRNRDKAWKLAAKLEAYGKKAGRLIHVNVEPVLNNAPHLTLRIAANFTMRFRGVGSAPAEMLPTGERVWPIPRAAGDLPGHEFHGNQYVVGAGEKAVAEKLGLPTTYKGMDSKSQFAGKAVDNPLPKTSALTHEQAKQLPLTGGSTKEVSISSLKSTQDYVQPSAVEYYKTGIYMKSQPIVATVHGEHLILNGNHNVVAAKLRGEKTISVLHLGDLSKQADAIKGRRALANFNMRFDASDPRAAKWAREHAAELATSISETTADRIKEAIAIQAETGEDAYDEILDAVGDEARAELIARTETMAAANEGNREAWDQAVEEGLLPEDARKVWIAAGDACPECDDLDGEEVALDEDYPNDGGDGPPLHPNCRCTEGIAS